MSNNPDSETDQHDFRTASQSSGEGEEDEIMNPCGSCDGGVGGMDHPDVGCGDSGGAGNTTVSDHLAVYSAGSSSSIENQQQQNLHGTLNRFSGQPGSGAGSSSGSGSSAAIKLGPAYREWYCCYCSFSSTSKYSVKQHCIMQHPGHPVDVSDVAFKLRAGNNTNSSEIPCN